MGNRSSRNFGEFAGEVGHRVLPTLPKVLLIGTGEQGASTITRRILNGHMSDTDEDLMYDVVRLQRCLIECTYQVIDHYQKAGKLIFMASTHIVPLLTVHLLPDIATLIVNYFPQDAEKYCNSVCEMIQNPVHHLEAFAKFEKHAIEYLWRYEPIFANVYARRRTGFQLTEAMPFRLSQVRRMMRIDYRPTPIERLYVRYCMSGIMDYRVELIPHRPIQLFRAGGQRNERRKWIHMFEETHTIAFMVGINQFCQDLYEDEKAERLTESLELWTELVNSRWFTRSSFILVLNMVDLFAARVHTGDTIKKLWPDYTGDNTMEDQLDYIQLKFLAVVPSTCRVRVELACAQNDTCIRRLMHMVTQTAWSRFNLRSARGLHMDATTGTFMDDDEQKTSSVSSSSSAASVASPAVDDVPLEWSTRPILDTLPPPLVFDASLHWPDPLVLPPDEQSLVMHAHELPLLSTLDHVAWTHRRSPIDRQSLWQRVRGDGQRRVYELAIKKRLAAARAKAVANQKK